MKIEDLRLLLADCPLIASVQASDGSAVDDPETLLKLAQASLDQGVKLLRLQGVENIRYIKNQTGVPVVGLIKKSYDGSEVYITATFAEVDQLASLGVEIIALDGTSRARPGGVTRAEIISRIHSHGILAMADCDNSANAAQCALEKADIIGTTLAGYTSESALVNGPDLDLLREITYGAVGELLHDVVIIAEGRYSQPFDVYCAKTIGADGIVIGGAINDPVKQTKAFLKPFSPISEQMGVVDIGGTWMRMSVLRQDGSLTLVEKMSLPEGRYDRLEIIEKWAHANEIEALGISSGGTIDPSTNTVIEAKSIIPDFVGTQFSFKNIKTFAINDGHATAFGQAMHYENIGKRVATLALGTGVGFGIVDRGEILMGPQGEYIRLNDIHCSDGRSFEDLLGGAALTATPSEAQKADANLAAEEAISLIRQLYYPEAIIICGGVGLSPWLYFGENSVNVYRSVYGADAGLMGASAYLMSKLRA